MGGAPVGCAIAWSVVAATALVASPAALSQQAAPEQAASAASVDFADRIDAFDRRYDEANRLSGVLLIARGDEIVHERAYGLAHAGLDLPNTTELRFCIASITKIFTTVTLNQMLQEGLLGAEDPVSKYIPDFPRGESIKIVDLARHRAGLPHRVTTAAEECLPLSAADVAAMIDEEDFVSEPGAASSYSSAGYTVLARCMEVASGKPFGELLRERIFEPAGMRDAIDPAPGRLIPRAAAGYVPGRGELWPAPPKDPAFLAGAGSVYATAADLWSFVQAMRADELGVPFSAYAQDGRVSWTGASNGYFAYIDTHPDDELTCIWVGNSWGGCAGALRSALPALWRGEEAPPPADAPALTATAGPDELAACVGEYEVRPGATHTVRVLGGELWLADSMILACGDDRWWHQPWQCELRFVRNDDGEVTALEQHIGGGVNTWPRVDPDATASR